MEWLHFLSPLLLLLESGIVFCVLLSMVILIVMFRAPVRNSRPSKTLLCGHFAQRTCLISSC